VEGVARTHPHHLHRSAFADLQIHLARLDQEGLVLF